MVSAILMCDKPVICRVNGMRIAGGQEIGMACDFSVAQDLALFGQAGPAARLGARRRQHGLPAALRRHRGARWRAARCASRGARTRRTGSACSRAIVPALKVDGRFVPQPARRHRPLARRRAHRLRRAQAGRRARGGQAGRSRAARSICRCSTARSTRSSSSSRTRCPAA